MNEAKPVTRFALYLNQALFPGWVQDPTKAPNTVTVRFLYYFDKESAKPDRIEVLGNVPLVVGNSFLYQSKVTEYYTDAYFGGPDGTVHLYIDPNANAEFPPSVTDGKLTVQIYGGSGPQPLFPVPISVEANPVLDRASWVKPPY